MDRIRVLIAGMQRRVLREILERTAAYQPDMEIVDSRADLTDLARVARDSGTQVVILQLGEDEIPEACSRLLDEIPGLVVVGLAGDGRRTAIHVDNIGTEQLADSIRAAVGSVAVAEPGGRT